MIEDGKYDRTLSMLCPSCGGDQFDFEDDEASEDVTCASCGLKATKGDLIEANEENISAQVDEIGKEVTKDIELQLKNSLRGIKGLTFK